MEFDSNFDIETHNRIINTENNLTKMYAQNGKHYGEFFVEGMLVKTYYTDEQITAISRALDLIHDVEKESATAPQNYNKIKRLYEEYIQTRNHETFHFYQCLKLPVFKAFCIAKKFKIEADTTVLLTAFDNNFKFNLRKHRHPLDILQNDFHADDELVKTVNDAIRTYDYYLQDFLYKVDEISVQHIIENMAHIFSLYISNTPSIDLLKLDSPIYNLAYKKYETHLDDCIDDVRLRYLMFLYICYFSCQHFEDWQTENYHTCLITFHNMIQKAPNYFEKLSEFKRTLTNERRNECVELIKNLTDETTLFSINEEKLSSLIAFIELIPILEIEAQQNKPFSNPETLAQLNSETAIVAKFSQFFDDHSHLFFMCVFPVLFHDIYLAHDQNLQTIHEKNSFNSQEESEFYDFISRTITMFNPKQSFKCCDEHGFTMDRFKALYCDNFGSVAFYVEQLTKKKAYNIFQII